MGELDLTGQATFDASQADAEVKKLKGDFSELAGTAGLATGATKEAAAVFDGFAGGAANVDAKLQAARTAIGEWAVSAVSGSKEAEAAFLGARDAVAALEVAIQNAKAAGAPVNPLAISALAAYDTALAEAAVATEGLEAAGVKGGKGINMMSVEATLARGNIGGLARSLATMGGSVAGAVLPILVIGAALKLLPMLFKAVDDGSKKWSESLVDLFMGLEHTTVAEEKADAATAKHDASVKHIQDTAQQYKEAMTGMVSGIIEETKNVGFAVAAWQGYHAAMTGNFEQYQEFVKALKAMGVTFRATHEEMTHEAQLFSEAYQTVIKRDGIEAANAWLVANKTVLEKISKYFEDAGQSIPVSLKPALAALEEFTHAEADAAEATKVKVADIAKQYDTLQASVVADLQKMRAARDADLAALDAETAKTVADIHTKEDALSAQWKAGTIGQDQYRREMDALLQAEQDKYTSTTAEKIRINESAKQSDEARLKEGAEASAKLVAQLTTEGVTLDHGRFLLEGYNMEQKASVENQRAIIETLAETTPKHEALNRIVREGAAANREIHKSISGIVKQTNAYGKAAAHLPKVHSAIAKSSPFKKKKGA